MSIRITLLFMAFLLCSCSQTKVHLYTKYLSNQQVNEIKQHLNRSNLIVIPNDLPFPATVNESTLVHSLTIQDRTAIDQIIHSLDDINWEINKVSALFEANHSYTKNAIGLMLLPPGVEPYKGQTMADWAHRYSSQDCGHGVSIHLHKNGQFEVTQQTNDKQWHRLTDGSWKITQFPFVELYSKQSKAYSYFEFKSDTHRDIVGEVQIYELNPLAIYPRLEGCRLVYGLRN